RTSPSPAPCRPSSRDRRREPTESSGRTRRRADRACVRTTPRRLRVSARVCERDAQGIIEDACLFGTRTPAHLHVATTLGCEAHAPGWSAVRARGSIRQCFAASALRGPPARHDVGALTSPRLEHREPLVSQLRELDQVPVRILDGRRPEESRVTRWIEERDTLAV